MKRKIKCNAVFFDLWNTLLEARSIVHLTRQKMGLGEYDFNLFIRKFEKATMRKRFPSARAFLLSAYHAFGVKPEKNSFSFLEKRWGGQIPAAMLYPETKKVLLALKARGFKLALVSNTMSFAGREKALMHFGIIQLFDSVQFSFATGLLKPEKKIFQCALRELKLKPKDVVMIGDSPTDIEGAKNAKISGILIDRHGKRKKIPVKPIAVISDLQELLDLLEFQGK